MKSDSINKSVTISAVIPSYNGATWLPLSIPKLDSALRRANVHEAEILVIDDGSTDNTLDVIKTIKTFYPLRVVSQQNSGRFLARKLGTEEARYSHILFIDTRIYIEKDAIKFVLEEMGANPERKVWTTHVYLDKQGNIYARFWDTITSLAWRKYFSNPRDYSYGLKEFDYFPKGTTCFFVPKNIIKEANDWFFKNTKDLKTSNDDTLLIRHIAEKTNININPRFSCIYHARSNFKQFIKHVFHRGKVFVDGFLRRDGNRFFWIIATFLVITAILPILLLILPGLILPLALLLGGIWLLGLLVILFLGISWRDAFSFFILIPPFVLAYGIGIWAATIKIYLRSR